jgi:hypothetical protein
MKFPNKEAQRPHLEPPKALWNFIAAGLGSGLCVLLMNPMSHREFHFEIPESGSAETAS